MRHDESRTVRCSSFFVKFFKLIFTNISFIFIARCRNSYAASRINKTWEYEWWSTRRLVAWFNKNRKSKYKWQRRSSGRHVTWSVWMTGRVQEKSGKEYSRTPIRFKFFSWLAFRVVRKVISKSSLTARRIEITITTWDSRSRGLWYSRVQSGKLWWFINSGSQSS